MGLSWEIAFFCISSSAYQTSFSGSSSTPPRSFLAPYLPFTSYIGEAAHGHCEPPFAMEEVCRYSTPFAGHFYCAACPLSSSVVYATVVDELLCGELGPPAGHVVDSDRTFRFSELRSLLRNRHSQIVTTSPSSITSPIIFRPP